jgi:hypothetical protein
MAIIHLPSENAEAFLEQSPDFAQTRAYQVMEASEHIGGDFWRLNLAGL